MGQDGGKEGVSQVSFALSTPFFAGVKHVSAAWVSGWVSGVGAVGVEGSRGWL